MPLRDGSETITRLWKKSLTAFRKALKRRCPEQRAVYSVIPDPVTEKAWAVRAGLGWRGRHSMIINKDIGSFFFLGEIVTTAEFLYENASSRDRCGECRLCIDACPTGAICDNRTVDARRCISYLTVEYEGDLPEEFRGKTEKIIFGCDRCQEVCPFNRKAVHYTDKELVPEFPVTSLSRKDWLAMTPEDFKKMFKSSAIKRTGFKIIKRNIDFVNFKSSEKR